MNMIVLHSVKPKKETKKEQYKKAGRRARFARRKQTLWGK